MRTWRDPEAVPTDLGRTVVTIGNFDGMHLGHQHVLEQARTAADRLGIGRVVAVTFDPHPIAVLRPEHAPPTLTTLEERAALMEAAGVDDMLVVPFSREVAAWSPETFIQRILVDALAARAVVVGANFRFGSRAAGDCNLLRAAGLTHDFEVVEVTLDGGPQVWSSTYTRTCLSAGDVSGAAEALGRLFATRGIVARGDQRGRELGYPTANVPVIAGAAAPADGVYAGWLTVLDGPDVDERYPAAISVGTNPTFDGDRERRIEAYVLDRTDLALYGRRIEVAFVERIRGMLRFDSVEDLLTAMADDVRRTRAILL